MAYAIVLLVSLALTGWVAFDAARRHRNWLAWALLASLLGILGILLWLILRRRWPVVESFGAGRTALLFSSAVPLVALVFIVVIFVNTFVVQVARVEGQAMMPTLADQDHVIVNKAAYRTRAPRSGDIVMLLYPLKPDKTFVMRVIAEEGDQVRLVRGKVFRNDVPLDESYVATSSRSHNHWGPEVVPEGHYFVLGDNRTNSSDSRHWGWVPKKYIVGRVAFRWWPLSRAGAL